MGAKQIYATVNTIAANISYTGSTVVDISTFTAFGASALSSPAMTESVYNALYDLIGRTVIAIDEAEEDERNIVVDAFEYGSILQKFSFAMQQAQKSSEWDIEHPENPYTVARKEGIIQTFFEQYIPTFSYEDVSYADQLKEAFRGPESLAGFTDALYTRMRNAYKVAKNGLSDAAIGGLMGNIYASATAVTPGANAARRVRHLLTEYNTAMGTELTNDTSRQNANYLEFVRKTLIKDRENMNKLTKLYNDATVERRTTPDELNLDVSLDFATAYDKFWADSYNESYVQLPKHNTIVNWGIATAPETVKVKLASDGDTITINKIIAFAYDRDAVVATMDRSRFVSIYDQWNDRNVFKLTANRRYIADPSENAIIYLND